MIESPPRDVLGILGRLGPGLIIAGSIVGSGELIGTTRTGAEAGFWLLWLIVIGCVIKVFAQIEMGRHTLTTGQTAMEGFNDVPGPRFGANWLLWYWLVMFLVSLAQLGGIVGGVGQAMAMSVPIYGDFNQLLSAQAEYDDRVQVERIQLERENLSGLTSPHDYERDSAKKRIEAGVAAFRKQLGVRPSEATVYTRDDLIWATLFTIATSILLIVGRYRLIEWVSTILVAGFTLITIVNLAALQSYPRWAISWTDIWNGLSFRFAAPGEDGSGALSTALKTFGIIGVGANELIAYPYWCIEKGYARFAGPRDNSTAWAERARGWMRVMQWDAWCSMIIYTFATVAFYLLGASVLATEGKIPGGSQLIRTLALMYGQVFGEWADIIFLSGAFAVLYSTFFIANAGHARVASDAFRIFGWIGGSPRAQRMWVKLLSGVFPFICLAVWFVDRDPVRLVLASGLMQALMLPMIAFATLYYRYHRCDPRLAPNRLWDVLLILSAVGFVFAGGSLIWLEVTSWLH